MFMGMGVAAFSAGIFHLMTHAFFKGLLFLGAGSVIHAMSDEQDMRKMGGLRKHLPVTYWTFVAATLAIAGVFPFAGFFSKDEILWKAWESGPRLLWAIGFAAAGLTAFYMFRLVALTFFGETRADEETKHHIHESPKVMLIPLAILAVLSVVGGWINVPEAMGGSARFHHWLAPVFGGHGAEAAASGAAHVAAAAEGAHGAGEVAAHEAAGAGHSTELVFAGLSLAWAVLWSVLGFTLYTRRIDLVDRLKAIANGAIHRLLLNKYYVDEIYKALFVDNLHRLCRAAAVFDLRVIDGAVNGTSWVTRIVSFLTGLFDNAFVDGMVNGVASVTRSAGQRLRVIQSGQIQGYLYFLFSMTVLILFIHRLL
jgi:NADH-quinone oxidoreductase subunit L